MTLRTSPKTRLLLVLLLGSVLWMHACIAPPPPEPAGTFLPRPELMDDYQQVIDSVLSRPGADQDDQGLLQDLEGDGQPELLVYYTYQMCVSCELWTIIRDGARLAVPRPLLEMAGGEKGGGASLAQYQD